MKSLYPKLLVVIGSMLAMPVLAAEFAVSPMLIELSGSANTVQDFEFSVHGKTAGNVKLSLFDLSQQESGHMDFIAIEEKQGLTDWISLDRENFTVKQGETEVITGKISTPRKASGSHLAAIMVEEEKQDDDKGGVAVTVRYAIVLTLDLGGKRKGRIKTQFEDLKIQTIKDELVISALFTNHSNQDHHLKSEVQLRDENKRLIDKIVLKTQSAWQRGDAESRVFPGAKVRVYGVISKAINSSQAHAVVRNKFGGRMQPSVRAELDAPVLLNTMQKAIAKNRQYIFVQPVKMKKRGESNAFGKIQLSNPTSEAVTIRFPKPTMQSKHSYRFSPAELEILPGQRKIALLTHDWNESITNTAINYKAKLLSEKQQTTLLIPTAF